MIAPALLSRDETIARIRTALRQRSGKAWSVTGGKGTSYGWITVQAPPARRTQGYFSAEDRAELCRLLGLTDNGCEVGNQGWSIPASSAFRAAAVQRAEKGLSSLNPQPYWD